MSVNDVNWGFECAQQIVLCLKTKNNCNQLEKSPKRSQMPFKGVKSHGILKKLFHQNKIKSFETLSMSRYCTYECHNHNISLFFFLSLWKMFKTLLYVYTSIEHGFFIFISISLRLMYLWDLFCVFFLSTRTIKLFFKLCPPERFSLFGSKPSLSVITILLWFPIDFH